MSQDGAMRLAIRGVSKRYGHIDALKSVNVDVRRGEVLALLGENGAGKSSLVKVLGGLTQPDTGEIVLDGETVDIPNMAAAQAAGIAIVTQEFSLVPGMSVAENLALGERASGSVWRRSRLIQEARTKLAGVGLQDLDPRTKVARLTVAERQLVEIAGVVFRQAKVLILDEPTAALSEAEVERVLPIVRGLADSGVSVIYVTHRLHEVFQVSDRVQIMRNGRALPALPTSDCDMESVVTAMLGRELGELFPPRSATSGDEPPALTIRDLAPTRVAPFSFAVGPGQILGLTGQLGSGASEVVQALAGMRSETTGSVTLPDGSNLDMRSRRHGIAQGVGYCSADRKFDGIFADISIRRNLSSPWLRRVAKGPWVSDAAEDRRAIAVCESFAIDPARLDQPVGELSGGNQQKVALGKWIGIAPTLLLADEPTRGVDIGARAEIYRQLRQLADSGVPVIVSSSDTSEVLGLCDVIATFYHGRVTDVRPAAQWSEEDLLLNVMRPRLGDVA